MSAFTFRSVGSAASCRLASARSRARVPAIASPSTNSSIARRRMSAVIEGSEKPPDSSSGAASGWPVGRRSRTMLPAVSASIETLERTRDSGDQSMARSLAVRKTPCGSETVTFSMRMSPLSAPDRPSIFTCMVSVETRFSIWVARNCWACAGRLGASATKPPRTRVAAICRRRPARIIRRPVRFRRRTGSWRRAGPDRAAPRRRRGSARSWSGSAGRRRRRA